MGRYDFAPQRVHAHATQLLAHKRIVNPPPWYNIIAAVPPAERLTRPPLQRSQRPGGKKASRLFKPLRLQYEEDRLRWDYFNDHPWELAKPRVVLEDDGRDAEKWDWSIPLDHALNRPKSGAMSEEGVRLDLEWDGIQAQQAGRPINGEAVVQRTNSLLNSGIPSSHASAIALAEFARHQHYTETSLRVAREEALATGAFFGPGPLEIGMMLEDRQYDGWRQWAEKEIVALKQLQGSAYTGQGIEGSGQDAALDAGTVDAEEGVAKG
ncbi:mitochondrial ribosomal small subunit component [Friedmanniomyces endolithicus]|uniref:Small ribosomal subunit protein mS23 n=1 Tax=Rachicladosporium monterosium TaxID=1507873 RepID=A0ABR0LGL4_9PEZI|nr:mitochondrial ribosomal small subunit component [Friedmanniomyces endolithicus]KAK1816778.1 mitochondrial ribosomal small subunit component [Friedmanniomyces endolithicus]KAK5148030.1 mitochondrial ribosomal small subunit component [Rachicladosporium monterosium]